MRPPPMPVSTSFPGPTRPLASLEGCPPSPLFLFEDEEEEEEENEDEGGSPSGERPGDAGWLEAARLDRRRSPSASSRKQTEVSSR